MDRIELVQGDIVEQEVDAIVNAANQTLLGGGGVDGAIHRAAGRDLLDECRTLGGCDTGNAKITGGYKLPAQYVIHAVGPIYRGGSSQEAQLLRSAYRSSLKLASDHDCQSIAFPSISTGAYGYPITEAARIALHTCQEWLLESALPISVRFVLFSEPDLKIYQQVLADLDKDN